jgi:hypothetical protein
VCDFATSHIEVLKWARANGAPWSGQLCASAAEFRKFEVLEWAYANGAHVDVRACAGAATNGYLDILQWLHSNGAPWDERVVTEVGNRRNLGMLQWIRENNVHKGEEYRDYETTLFCNALSKTLDLKQSCILELKKVLYENDAGHI